MSYSDPAGDLEETKALLKELVESLQSYIFCYGTLDEQKAAWSRFYEAMTKAKEAVDE